MSVTQNVPLWQRPDLKSPVGRSFRHCPSQWYNTCLWCSCPCSRNKFPTLAQPRTGQGLPRLRWRRRGDGAGRAAGSRVTASGPRPSFPRKYEEIYPPEVDEFVYITDDTYTKRQLLRMEHLLLKVLAFDLTVPTTHQFLLQYLRRQGVCVRTENLAKVRRAGLPGARAPRPGRGVAFPVNLQLFLPFQGGFGFCLRPSKTCW